MAHSTDEPHHDAGLAPSAAHHIEQAAHWIIRLRYEAADEQTQREFAHWLNQSTDHAQAWARAESVLGTFERLPPVIGKQALQSTLNNRRRRVILRAALGAVALAPVAFTGMHPAFWRTWTADASTATGERRSISLADGTRVVLNTRSAVDIVYTSAERRIVLQAGEILVTTAREANATYRPVVVETRQGVVQALGTRFTVRDMGEHIAVTVLEHAVQLRPSDAQPVNVEAGERAIFNARQVGQSYIASPGAALWEHGMFVANDMRLGTLVAELARYRSGILRCAADVADLRVTATVSLDDTDAALAMLAQTLRVKVQRISRYWVTVEAA